MRILAFSDLHRDADATRRIVDASGQADVLVAAGDFGSRGEGTLEPLEILRTAAKPTVVVSGNHDNSRQVRDFCADWDDGHLLQGTAVSFGGFDFFGLGGEIPRRHDEHWNEALDEAEAIPLLAGCPENAVLVTHSPPLGIADLQKNGVHEGSSAIRATIETKRPILHLCGHIHFSQGKTGMIGRTRIHNLGPGPNWFGI